MKRAFEVWSDSSVKKINHSFMSSEPDNQPIRHRSEQLNILAPMEQQHLWHHWTQRNTAPVESETPVEPVNCYWNTTVILAELKFLMSSYLFMRKFGFDFIQKFHVSKICVIGANGENTLN